MSNLDIALQYHRDGWQVIAANQSKKPVHPWKSSRLSDHDVHRFFGGTDNLVGIVTGAQSGIFVVDPDEKNGKQGIAALAAAGELPPTYTVRTRSGGRHLYFRHPGNGVRIKTISEILPGVDVRGDGGYVVAPGNNGYEVIDGNPMAEAPSWLLEMVTAVDLPGMGDAQTPSDLTEALHDQAVKNAAIYLQRLSANCDRETWLRVLMAVHEMTRGSAAGYELVLKWSATGGPAFSGEKDVSDRWKSFTVKAGGIGEGTLRHLTDGDADLEIFTAGLVIGQLPKEAQLTAPFVPHRIVETVDTHLVADQTTAALKAVGAPFYHRGGKMVEPVERDGKVTLSTVEQAGMIDHMSRAGDFVRLKMVTVEAEDGTKSKQVVDVPIKPPVDVASVVLSRAKNANFDTIHGTSKIPVMRSDGSIASAPGYDKATGIYIARDVPTLPPIPDAPTLDDARAALSLLLELIAESPIADDASRSVAISALMTPVLRTLMDVVPLHAFTAPEAGSGKSFLCNLAGTFTYLSGYVPAISIGDDEAEFEKRLASQLMTGQPVLLFDNVNGTIGGDLVCQAVTAPMVSLRPLGRSEMIEVKNNYMILVNGNNLSVVADLVRRTVRCTMDSKTENPWEREFRRNPIREVLADPGRYLAAVFTIARAYMIATGKQKLRPFASFEQWSDSVRAPLIWLGMADALDTQYALKSDDPARDALAGIIGLWQWAGPVTAGQIITGVDPNTPGVESGGNADLRAHLLSIASTDGRTINPNKLGAWFKANDGKRANGRTLRRTHDSHGKRWLFSIE
ncbi:bifunctional DNA primase/polymerase [Rhizobium leguminosarum]|uniref:bifunctional DNA primase/polymerase n=1 Tax=Rhizobium leguminosarum TaxID=384 RepID=UPI001AE97FFE|nr:bifunctional DNA primase/polymerase [Rhizobium leguminosarum]MBP2444836.1 hypothetical protein [Rhizobium leguminosarum]